MVAYTLEEDISHALQMQRRCCDAALSLIRAKHTVYLSLQHLMCFSTVAATSTLLGDDRNDHVAA
jgi:hypothetical protein